MEKYTITPRYLTSGTKRRSGQALHPGVTFIVAHDTGNPNSTATGNVSYYERTNNEMYASAHIFVDDKNIIECIPALTSTRPEKAWHVRYNLRGDNERYGYAANDAAIGVEYCYGTNINANEAYKRYVWVMAYICYRFGLNPETDVIGHHILDPNRRRDPVDDLSKSGKTYEMLLQDVKQEYDGFFTNEHTVLPMKLIKNTFSHKIYAIGKDNKKHWIFNMETFRTGQAMGLWGGLDSIDIQNDDAYEEGHSILLVR